MTLEDVVTLEPASIFGSLMVSVPGLEFPADTHHQRSDPSRGEPNLTRVVTRAREPTSLDVGILELRRRKLRQPWYLQRQDGWRWRSILGQGGSPVELAIWLTRGLQHVTG